ncbi:MAG: collagen-like protein [Deltaproteobacteria bacterium]|nr:collagen-like protein [Deltaproteobacteria bacterium]
MKSIYYLIGALSISTAFAQTESSELKVHKATDVLVRSENKGRAVYFGDDLNLAANETLVFDEPATVYLNSLKMDSASSINTNGNKMDLLVRDQVDSDNGVIDVSFNKTIDVSGQDGPVGEDGAKAADALKGGAAASGTNATSGGAGGDGQKISILTPYLRGNIILITKGGDGGRGGNGGDGGVGGKGFSGMDARVLYHFRGMDGLPIDSLLSIGAMIGIPYVGQVLAILSIFNGIKIGDGFDGFDGGRGGNGGNGGFGGNGGNAGDISLVYGRQVDGTKIYINTRGGKAGAAGRAGLGGVGGMGGEGGQAGDIFARDGKPGKSGEAGVRGVEGRPGNPGKAGKVSVVETDDPKWVGCYVQYKELLEMGEDVSFAREMLRACDS